MKYEALIREIPSSLKEECEFKGTIETITYTTTDYKGNPDSKYAFVYVPYGYNAREEYEIMYLIHGGFENAEKYLYQDGEANPLKRIVDNLTAQKEIKQTLIVTPSWYPNNKIVEASPEECRRMTQHFPQELPDLMKAVETKYHTFAKTADDKGFKESRTHRCVCGWSMGSVTTWFIFDNHIAYFNRFGNMSCDSWVVGWEGGRVCTEETVQALKDSIDRQGFEPKDFFIYAITGDKDIAYPTLGPQMQEMMKHPDKFVFEGENQNASYLLWPDGEHHTQWRLLYSYNVIRNFLG